MTQVFFLMDDNPLSFRHYVMKSGTGCTAYHCGFISGGFVFDIVPRGTRMISASDYIEKNKGNIIILPAPVDIPFMYLKGLTKTDSLYGFADLFGFILRYFKYKVTDKYGLICSEKVVEDLINNGWETDKFDPKAPPPSPCELLEYLRYEYRYRNS
jgi:hypothetical protein